MIFVSNFEKKKKEYSFHHKEALAYNFEKKLTPALEHHLGTKLSLNTFQKNLSMTTYHNLKLNPAIELQKGSAKWHTSRVGKEAPFFLYTSQCFYEKNHTRLLH